MRDDVLEYYEQELAYLRRSGMEFARQYPKVAARLQLEPTRCEDPHVERLLEGLAFLTARVHKRIDDDLPELAQALLDVVHPNATRPLPSMALVQLLPDVEQAQLAGGYTVPVGSPLYLRASGGVTCRFRTTAPTALWPIAVSAVHWVPGDRLGGATAGVGVGAVRVVLRTTVPGLRFAQLELERLRFHLVGEMRVVSMLYELLGARCTAVLVRDPALPAGSAPRRLPATVLEPIGFAPEETLLPTTRRALAGYELLRDYFALPEKFFGFDLCGLSAAVREGTGSEIVLDFVIDRLPVESWRATLERDLDAELVRLGCVPIVNLFPQASEPMQVTQQRLSYRVLPDAYQREHLDVFSVDAVVAVEPSQATPRRFRPLHAYRHGEADGASDECCWFASRKAGTRPGGSGDLWLTFADRDARPVRPPTVALTARLTCTNGELPSRLSLLDDGRDFTMPGSVPVAGIHALVLPTRPAPPAARGAHLWRLVSALSLAQTSLIEDGPLALQALLRLHLHRASASAEQQIQGITALRTSTAHARITSGFDVGYVRGRRVEVELDDAAFTGGSAYLLASVLERFLGLYVSINSFTQLVARTRTRVHPLREWRPRSGWKPLA
jgi:type VI secretion system protein ImpG